MKKKCWKYAEKEYGWEWVIEAASQPKANEVFEIWCRQRDLDYHAEDHFVGPVTLIVSKNRKLEYGDYLAGTGEDPSTVFLTENE